MSLMLHAFILFISIFLPQSDPDQEVEIQFLANEGFLISSGETQILIDGAFKKEFDYLDVLAESGLNEFKNAEGKFSSLDIILATHLHGDHFNAELIGNHLSKNTYSTFLGPNETVKNFKANFEAFGSISNRVMSESPEPNSTNEISINGTSINVIRTYHSGNAPWNLAENNGYLINIGGRSILHLGDAKIDSSLVHQLAKTSTNVDLVILPYWSLQTTEVLDMIYEQLKPKQILIAHIPLAYQKVAPQQVKGLGYENMVAMVKQFEIITIN